MFYGSYEIHKKILNTIVDDKDNDIIFIVGKKGINKTGVLKEIEKNIVDSFYYSYGDFDLSVSCSFITHCFMD